MEDVSVIKKAAEMNAEHLLTHFDRIADAPDAIPRLRRFILDLAVRGKLVPQDPNDEPASELLKRIAAEKAWLVKLGQSKKQKAIPALAEEELPFTLPSNWKWSQIAEIGVLNPRNEVTDDAPASFVPMSMIAADYGVAPAHEVRRWGEIKKGYTHFAEGDVGLAKITPCFENGKSTVFQNLAGGLGSGTTELHIVRPLLVDPNCIILFFKSSHFIETGIPKMTGTAGQKRVPTEYFANSPFPLPPLSEQHRIVAKVNELMTLCDRLEAARMEREATRDRMATGSLARLNAPDPDLATFQNHTVFALTNLTPLTTRPDQVKALRQTILNLAVRGKLVEQDTKEGTSRDLLLQLEKARNTRYAIGPARKQKRDDKSAIADDEKYPDLPTSWEWSRLSNVGKTQTGTSPSSAMPAFFGDFIPFIKPADLDGNEIRYDGPGLSEKGIEHSRLVPGESVLMVCIGATLGKVNKTTRAVCFNQQINSLTPYVEGVADFIALAFRGSGFQDLVWSKAGTGTLPIISKGKWEVLPVPLPPLAEQHRIVAKVAELMTLCDQLETSFTTGNDIRRRLLDALLHETLELAGIAGNGSESRPEAL